MRVSERFNRLTIFLLRFAESFREKFKTFTEGYIPLQRFTESFGEFR